MKVLQIATFLIALAALGVSIVAVSTPGPRGETGPQGETGAVGAQGVQGLRGPRGLRGVPANTGALEARVTALEGQVDLVHQTSGADGLEAPTTEFDVPSYAGGDLDCSDFAMTDFPTPPGDPDGLDADGDGVACES